MKSREGETGSAFEMRAFFFVGKLYFQGTHFAVILIQAMRPCR